MGHFDEDYHFSVNPNIINNVDSTERFNAAINECSRNLDILFARGADTENELNLNGLLSLASDVDSVIYSDSIGAPSYNDSESSFSSNMNVEEDSELATGSNESTDSDSVDSADTIDYITEIEITIESNNGFRYARFNFLPTRNDD